MKRRLSSGIIGGLVLSAGLAAFTAAVQSAPAKQQGVEREDYLREPMPAGIQVVVSDVEGPVFADAKGHTLYIWPRKALRNGDIGEAQGSKPQCNDDVTRETVGLESPYPAGLLLPELDTRPACSKVWPPVLASDKAKPLGKWTIVERESGLKQWAYDGSPVYTSMFDKEPGDTFGGTKRPSKIDAPAVREPVGPPSNVPSEFSVAQTTAGRLLVTFEGYSVYSWDRDEPTKSQCDGACLKEWAPVLAPQSSHPQGEWAVVERSPGIRQWVFRGKPVYTRVGHQLARSLEGSDVPGWHNVYTQHAPAPPREFTIQDTRAGQVLADAHGKTIYTYICSDDSADELSCDHPDMTQTMRFAICGGGDAERCLKTFPPVYAAPDAKSDNRAWTAIDIDPKTGHRVASGQSGALHVWAFRDRPVYTFTGDKKPGDINGDAWGEYTGWRDGFKAFWLRDDFFNNTG